MSETIETLFRTPQDALVFAYNYSMQRQDRSLVDRLAAPSPRTGKGLSGNDGAGQAGMIRRLLSILSTRELAVLAVLYAPRSWPCSCRSSCCSGHMRNPEYDAAIETLDVAALEVLSGRIVHYQLRRGLLEKAIFEHRKNREKSLPKPELKTLAIKCGVAEGTADAHWKLIKAWFLGQPRPHRIKPSPRRRVVAGSGTADVADAEDGGTSVPTSIDGLASIVCKKADEILLALPCIGTNSNKTE